jgi:hypothetical protein
MSDPAWLDGLLFGLPKDFDFTQIRTLDHVDALMVALPNRDNRGAAALALLGVPKF